MNRQPKWRVRFDGNFASETFGDIYAVRGTKKLTRSEIEEILNANTEEEHNCEDYRATDSRCGHDECFHCGKILDEKPQHPCPECGGNLVYFASGQWIQCNNCGDV